MSTPKRKAPIPSVRRPPVLPPAEPLDPATVAGFVKGTEAPGHQGTEHPIASRTEALVPEDREPTADPPSPDGPGAPPVPPRETPKPESTGAPAPQGVEASVAPTGRALVARAGGKAARRVVAYLDPADAKRLALRGVEEGRDLSAMIGEAVRRFLDG